MHDMWVRALPRASVNLKQTEPKNSGGNLESCFFLILIIRKGLTNKHVIGSRRACTETTEIRPGYGAARENHSVLLNQDIHLKIENRRELAVG